MMRGGFSTREQAEKQGVSFGIGSTATGTTTGTGTTTDTGTTTTGTGITSDLADAVTTTDDDLKQISDGTDTQPDFTGTPFGTGDDTGQQQQQQTTTGTPSAFTYTSGQGQTQLDDAQKHTLMHRKH